MSVKKSWYRSRSHFKGLLTHKRQVLKKNGNNRGWDILTCVCVILQFPLSFFKTLLPAKLKLHAVFLFQIYSLWEQLLVTSSSLLHPCVKMVNLELTFNTHVLIIFCVQVFSKDSAGPLLFWDNRWLVSRVRQLCFHPGAHPQSSTQR